MRRVRAELGSRRPTVSVVIPCYRYGSYLEGAVASALDQHGLDVDVLIIDDASPDDSAAVARRLAEADGRVRALVHEENKGHIATYNEGLMMATGTYVVLLSADDLLAPDALTRAVALMEAEPSVGLVYGHSPQFVDRPPLPAHRPRRSSVWTGEEWLGEIATRGRNLLSTPEAVMRTSVFRDIGGYDPVHPHAGDFLMWMRAATRADVGRVNGCDQAFYRVHGANMHLTAYAGLRTDFEERRRAFEVFLELDGDRLPDPVAFSRRADRAMAREGLKLAVDALDATHPDPELAARFAELAVEAHPPVTRSRAYATYRRRRDRHGAGAPAPRSEVAAVRARRVARSLEGKIRWRRWRWSGL